MIGQVLDDRYRIYMKSTGSDKICHCLILTLYSTTISPKPLFWIILTYLPPIFLQTQTQRNCERTHRYLIEIEYVLDCHRTFRAIMVPLLDHAIEMDSAQSRRTISSEPRRILYIDAYDSFANNVVGLLQQTTKAQVTVIRIDDKYATENFTKLIKAFDAIVVGPGPGHPSNPEDVGVINQLWQLSEEDMVPVLGICLGFQSLCLNHGASVTKLRQARHGIICQPIHQDTDIFSQVGVLEATQYHSLFVNLLSDASFHQKNPWLPSEKCPKLLPLAWEMDDAENGPILMGVRHSEKPFWGVQFHPESICTCKAGQRIMSNWWKQVLASPFKEKSFKGLQQPFHLRIGSGQVKNIEPGHEIIGSHLLNELRSVAGDGDAFLRFGSHSGVKVSPADILEALNLNHNEVILLDSQGHSMGRFSILGVTTPGKTMRVTYNAYRKVMQYGFGPARMHSVKLDSIDSVWPILQEALDMHAPQTLRRSSRPSSPGYEALGRGLDCFNSGHPPSESPFWGGFMGYISYEAGLETIDVELDQAHATGIPDINFAFIHRSLVIDHQESKAYIQSLLPGDWPWILDVGSTIDGLVCRQELGLLSNPDNNSILQESLNGAVLNRPTESSYKRKIRECQEFLATGDSYELCLTDETEIKIAASNHIDPWQLYKQLRMNNAAPFGAYMHLSNMTVVGSSPERFLQWTRQGHCQFRPIKGTVKKGPEMTSERAHQILNTSKERAENLMIVDLIRHDLCGVVGVDNSWVPKLMVVEEYEKVYQLVSVIEGQLAEQTTGHGPRGMDVLRASLPPGSMTGAPKKRSCTILRDVESRARGVYSGVLGYMDVGGAGDFSVVIRTAVHHEIQKPDSTQLKVQHNDRWGKWTVGAGGAVTIQSSDQGEFEEMETKASSVLEALSLA